eukprot:13079374-Alexandrium_andersonii.AAC.1
MVKATKAQWDTPVETHPDKDLASQQVPIHGQLLVLRRCCLHLVGLANARRPGPGQPWPKDLTDCWHSLAKKAHRLGPEGPGLPDIVPHESPWTRVVVAGRLRASLVVKHAQQRERDRRDN